MAQSDRLNLAKWYVRKRGSKRDIGPLTRDELRQLWKQKKIKSRDEIFAEGVLPDWVRAGRLLEILESDSPEQTEPNLQPPVSSPQPQVPVTEVFLIQDDSLRGPISVPQLDTLVRFGEISLFEIVCDETQRRQTTVGKFLETGILPHEVVVHPVSTNIKNVEQQLKAPTEKQKPSSTSSKPNRSITNAAPRSRPTPNQQTPAYSESTSPKQKPRRKKESRRQKKKRKRHNQKAAQSRKSMREKDQSSIVWDDALSTTMPTVAPIPRKKAKNETPSDDVIPTLDDSDQTEIDHKSIPWQRFLRSSKYRSACTQWSAVYLAISVLFLFATNATMAMFLRRLGGLCLSTFIPFQTTPEELKGDSLLLAGFSTVMLGAIWLYPLWHVLRSDCPPWHCLFSTIMGGLFGLVMQPIVVGYLLTFAQWAVIFGGFVIILIGINLMFRTRHAPITQAIMIALSANALGISVLGFCSAADMFKIDIKALPPTISGSAPGAIIFLIATYMAMISIPLFCYVAVSIEASRSVKEFMDGQWIVAAASGVVVCFASYWMVNTDPNEFVSIPLLFIPIGGVNAVVALVPPVLWFMHPVNAGIR